MKKLKFVIILLTILIIVLPAFCTRSFGAEDIITNFDSYKGNGGSYTKLLPKVNSIAGVIASVGSVVSIIALVIIGIKYVLGSAEERADYKKTMIPYIIGAILVFSMTTLPMIIYNIMNSI